MTDAVKDQRAGSSLDEDDPAPPAEPEQDTETGPPAGDPRTTIAGRYSVDLTTPPNGAGIAVTYRGRDLRTRDPVLVKTLRLEYRGDPDMRARFRREARLLQFLSHPNVIRALTYSEERGAPWLILEQVRGRSLREEISARAPMSPEAVVPLLTGLAAALDHLHARGLVHLDVRPENAMVTPDGGIKLVDFGLAQAAGTQQDAADATEENLAYLAPEQACGEPVSAATDVYALGCVVYEMLAGQLPFVPEGSATQRNAAIRARLEQAPVPPSAARGDGALPAWVDDVVLGALERDPRLRYGSATSFATVFRSGVEGEIDVETGRPHRRDEPNASRQIPVNEPGVAVKGAPLLASRRGKPPDNGPGSNALDVAFSTHSADESATRQEVRRARRRDFDALGRWLWRAVILAAVLNVLLIAALLASRGEIPGVWGPAPAIGPGAMVRIAGVGLVARAAPDLASPIVADLPEGGTVRISGEPAAGPDGLWWPVEIETADGIVRGYVPQSWVQAP